MREQPKPETLGMLLIKVHEQIKQRAILVFQLIDHPDCTDEQVIELRKRTQACGLRQQWENLRRIFWALDVELHQYHMLPAVNSPVKRLLRGNYDHHGWKRWSTASIKRKLDEFKKRNPDYDFSGK